MLQIVMAGKCNLSKDIDIDSMFVVTVSLTKSLPALKNTKTNLMNKLIKPVRFIMIFL